MESILAGYEKSIIEKASGIKAIVFDVDGVMTDGKITYTNTGDELKSFNVKDGQIIKPLKRAGILLGAITGRESDIVMRRCQELRLDFHRQNAKDKFEILTRWLEKNELSLKECCYVGDDLIDMECLNKVGLGVSPADAPDYVKDVATLVSSKAGGEGVVREVGELILASKGLLRDILDGYLHGNR